MIHDKIAYWRYPQPADRQDEGGNEHRAWRLVRQLRAENAQLLADRDWWRVSCYWALTLGLFLASALVLVTV